MMPPTLDTSEILAYNAKHGVLICRECKYAVQKSALGSHLLRHKVYRRERQRLLAAAASLNLLEPDDVQPPGAGSLPVEGLPILSGYRCTAAGCGNLCASSKRMRRHWSEKHDEPNPPVPFSRPVLLQTFFRGTKLRYFEVRSEPGVPGDTAGTGECINPVASSPSAHHADHLQMLVPRRPTLHPSTPDLETLRYFHHFTTTANQTLPDTEGGTSTYWTVDVVAQALRLPWLMSGLLAISASHMGALSDEGPATTRAHFERSAQFSQEFIAVWEGEAKKLKTCSTSVEGIKAGAQIGCILRCCHWLSEASLVAPMSAAAVAPFSLRLLINTVRGCSDPEFALRSAVDGEDTSGEDQATCQAEAEANASSNASALDGAVLPAFLQRLRSLPPRMLGPLGKPKSALDFFATLAATDTLVECCSLSYASDDRGMVWMGMESWLRRVPGHFHQMVWCRSAGAIVVLAHWSVMVERAERHFWFLKGLAAHVRRQCTQDLPDHEGIQGLIKDLAPVSEVVTPGA